ncbi:MAG: hypothetical protein G01um101425_1027 [Candidatus Peregrinibacteria bacterium Gr01-1014_25]|nr:MAG: hypothetical protein G01um101425_1027 [Candidatus Peregrinibacteria bacterium Gr01-1014_25]
MFTGQYPYLYKGTERRVPVTDGVLTERKLVRPVVMLDHAEQLFIGIDFLEPDNKEKSTTRWGATFGPDADIVGAFRAMRLLELEPKISMEVIEQDCIAASGLIADSSTRDAVRARIGEKFDQTMREMPDSLMDALRLLACHDVQISKVALVQEIRAGRLRHTDELQQKFGVEHPDVIDERERRRQALVEPFVPYFRQWFAQNAAVTQETHKPGCRHERFLRDMAYACLRKGVTDPAQVVGMSLAFQEVGIGCIGELMLDALAGNDTSIDSLVKRKLMSICNFLVEQFEGAKTPKKTPSDYYSLLTSIKNSWNSLPQQDV